MSRSEGAACSNPVSPVPVLGIDGDEGEEEDSSGVNEKGDTEKAANVDESEVKEEADADEGANEE